jgi:methyltransferase (TIGR00027 family)
MDAQKASITALVCGFTRAYHAKNDSPKIFDDFWAERLLSPDEYAFMEKSVASLLNLFEPETAGTVDEESARRLVMQKYNSSTVLSRARFIEDCLEKAISAGIDQYVILGAGLDTFALRRPELADRLRVFEVDHPASQTDKKDRLMRVAGGLPGNLVLIPVDFETDDLRECLLRNGFIPEKPAFFSWPGVTYYLDLEAIRNTLRIIADLGAPGSELVFDYADDTAFDPARISDREKKLQSITRQTGEPMKTGFIPVELEAELSHFGFGTRENLDPAGIEKRYFSNRADLYHAFDTAHFLHAVKL